MNDYCSAFCLPLTAARDVINLGRDTAASTLFPPLPLSPPLLCVGPSDGRTPPTTAQDERQVTRPSERRRANEWPN